MNDLKIMISVAFAGLILLIGGLNTIYAQKETKLSTSNFEFINKKVELPADDAFQSNQDIQWWYWTGHLETVDENEEKKEFGFELVFFAFNSWGVFKHQLAHAAISDISNNSHHYIEEVKYLNLPKKNQRGFDLYIDKNSEIIMSAKGNDGDNELYAEIGNYIFELELEETKSPIIHYGGERHNYSFGGYTYYYSREKMETSGTIEIDGIEYEVEGLAWFDRQYGNLYSAIFKGWQWFAITMTDGSNIMIYDFLGEHREEKYGSITENDETKYLKQDDYDIKTLEKWKSPDTGVEYPSGWEISIKGKKKKIIVEPIIEKQELKAKHIMWIGPEYWEGNCLVKDEYGKTIGKAYVELNGFGKKFLSFNFLDNGKTDFGI